MSYRVLEPLLGLYLVITFLRQRVVTTCRLWSIDIPPTLLAVNENVYKIQWASDRSVGFLRDCLVLCTLVPSPLILDSLVLLVSSPCLIPTPWFLFWFLLPSLLYSPSSFSLLPRLPGFYSLVPNSLAPNSLVPNSLVPTTCLFPTPWFLLFGYFSPSGGL